MDKNVGGYDRLARFVVGPLLIVGGGAALGGVVTIAAGTLGLVLAGIAVAIGVVLVATATTQKCPLNATIGLNTYRTRPSRESSSDEGQSSPK
jgi:hypothetical protein